MRRRDFERRQGKLFEPSALQPLPPDVVVACTACGRPIIAQHFVPGGAESQFRDGAGRCYDCAFPPGSEGFHG